MNYLIAMQASQKAMDGATDTLNTTAIGAAFVLQFFLMAGLVWYIVRQSSKEKESMRLDAKEKTLATNVILATKDKRYEDAIKVTQDVALSAVKVGTIMEERMDTLIELQKDVLKLIRKEGNGGGTPSGGG